MPVFQTSSSGKITPGEAKKIAKAEAAKIYKPLPKVSVDEPAYLRKEDGKEKQNVCAVRYHNDNGWSSNSRNYSAHDLLFLVYCKGRDAGVFYMHESKNSWETLEIEKLCMAGDGIVLSGWEVGGSGNRYHFKLPLDGSILRIVQDAVKVRVPLEGTGFAVKKKRAQLLVLENVRPSSEIYEPLFPQGGRQDICAICCNIPGTAHADSLIFIAWESGEGMMLGKVSGILDARESRLLLDSWKIEAGELVFDVRILPRYGGAVQPSQLRIPAESVEMLPGK